MTVAANDLLKLQNVMHVNVIVPCPSRLRLLFHRFLTTSHDGGLVIECRSSGSEAGSGLFPSSFYLIHSEGRFRDFQYSSPTYNEDTGHFHLQQTLVEKLF